MEGMFDVYLWESAERPGARLMPFDDVLG